MQENKQSVLLALVVIVLVLIGGYFWLKQQVAPIEEPIDAIVEPVASGTPVIATTTKPVVEQPKIDESIWNNYKDVEFGIEFKYPAYIASTTNITITGTIGYAEPGFSFHFLSKPEVGATSTVVSIIKEGVAGMSCYLSLCQAPVKTKLVAPSATWDNVGHQRYCDGGGGEGGCSANGDVYRATIGNYRYYIHLEQKFFNTPAKVEMFIKSFKVLTR